MSRGPLPALAAIINRPGCLDIPWGRMRGHLVIERLYWPQMSSKVWLLCLCFHYFLHLCKLKASAASKEESICFLFHAKDF